MAKTSTWVAAGLLVFWGSGLAANWILRRRRAEAAPPMGPQPVPPFTGLPPVSPEPAPQPEPVPPFTGFPPVPPEPAPRPSLFLIGDRVIDTIGRLGTIQNDYRRIPNDYFVYFDNGDREIVLETNLSLTDLPYAPPIAPTIPSPQFGGTDRINFIDTTGLPLSDLGTPVIAWQITGGHYDGSQWIWTYQTVDIYENHGPATVITEAALLGEIARRGATIT